MKYLFLIAATLSTMACARTTIKEAAVNGKDGQSCTVEQLVNGALIKCATSMAVVYNGIDGANGTDGVDGADGTDGTNGTDGRDGAPAPVTFGVRGYIYPCNNVNSNKEVFLRMTDGSILAVYDGGNGLSRLAKLQPGNYITTDGATCNISISTGLTVTTSPVAATGLVTQ